MFETLELLDISDAIYLRRINRDLQLLENCTGSTEGFISSIIDSVQGLFMNFKATINKALFNKVRSEYQAYVDSNRLKLKKINELSYIDVAELQIPIMRGMRLSYIDTAHSLSNVIKLIDILTRINTAASDITALYRAIAGTQSVDNILKKAFDNFNSTTQGKAVAELKKITIPDDKIFKQVFSSAFNSMGEFTEVGVTLLQMADYYNDITFVVKQLTVIEDTLDKIVEYLQKEENTSVTKQNLKELSQLAYLYASMFDTYGQTILIFQRVDHNYTDCCKTIAISKKI